MNAQKDNDKIKYKQMNMNFVYFLLYNAYYDTISILVFVHGVYKVYFTLD